MNTSFSQGVGLDQQAQVGGLRILHLEDSPIDGELIHMSLEKAGLPCLMHRVEDQMAFETSVREGDFDLILCDHNLPSYTGFEALEFVQKHRPSIPVIILSGSLDDEQAVKSLQNGAADYLLKERLARLGPAVRRALAQAVEKKQRTADEQQIKEQADLLDLTHDAIVVLTMEGRISSWNRGAETLFGWSKAEVIGQKWQSMLRGDEAILTEVEQSVRQTGDWFGEIQLQGKADERKVVLSRWTLLRNPDGQARAILLTNTDITERKKLETVLLRSQRMDSIGTLAGGIAHDLNNALAPILMSTELLRDCDDKDTRKNYLKIIQTSVGRGTGMVRQILNFAHGRNGGKQAVAVDQLLREMEKMALNVFPKSIEISTQLDDAQLQKVQGDPTELHQILLNLCVNARDAMPNGGRIVLSAQNVILDPIRAEALHGRPGPHVMVSVADNGTGIPPEVLPRIFEPFFTTKAPDKGTGLGLATVADIIRRHGGCLDIQTSGQGTEFQIYLPVAQAAQNTEVKAETPVLPMGHGELVLIIEDEKAMRELTKSTLENYGYRAVTAENGLQGLYRFKHYGKEIKVVVTDTDMPQLNGLAAVRAMRQSEPDLPVIIASGSKHSAEDLRRIDAQRMINLGKPYTIEQLLNGVSVAIKPG